MRKKIKIIVIIFLVITLVPLLFFNKGSAEEYYPIATPDNAEFTDIMTDDLPKQDLINSFSFFREIADGSTSQGQLGRLVFNMQFEVQYVQAFIQLSTGGYLTTENFTREQILSIMQLYEICWLHLILEFAVCLYVASGCYKFIKGQVFAK